MKRFAAHYLFLSSVGFIKQQVVEVTEEGYVKDVFSFSEEIESVEWLPGVIALLSVDEMNTIKNIGMFETNIPMFQIDLPNVSSQSFQCFKEALDKVNKTGKILYPCLFYPFDFISMRPVAGTQHRLLR